jgi:hypothetical protein
MSPQAGDAQDALNALREARSRVDEVRPLLEDASPTALDRCTPLLTAAEAAARNCHPRPGQTSWSAEPDQGRILAEETALLRTSIRRTARLLESAASYHARWNSLLGAMSAGYTASGAPANPCRTGRLSVRG